MKFQHFSQKILNLTWEHVLSEPDMRTRSIWTWRENTFLFSVCFLNTFLQNAGLERHIQQILNISWSQTSLRHENQQMFF